MATLYVANAMRDLHEGITTDQLLIEEKDPAKTDSVSDLKPVPKPIKTVTDAYKRLTKPTKKKVAIKQQTDKPRDSSAIKEWQPHPDAKREVIDDDGPGDIVKISNPDGTEKWPFIPPKTMDVDIPEEEALEIVAEGVDTWLTSMGEETGGKVAQKLLLTIGLWAVENDRAKAISTFEECVRLLDETKEGERAA
jgi:hypothetical protein